MNAIECAFTGRLGSDPELRTSQAGKPWCRFSVAIGEGDDVQWVSVAAFGEAAERVSDLLAKGDRAYVEGTLRLNEWTDREGLTRHGLQVAAWRVEALGKIGRRKPKPKGNPAARGYARPLDTDSRPARQQHGTAAEVEIPF
jgi:single stranded DNA-binding protein